MTNPVEFSDLGPIRRVGLQGKGVASWLSEQGVNAPASVLSVETLEGHGRIARTGECEFFLESTVDDFLAGLESRIPTEDRPVYQVTRDEVTWLLRGPLAPEVMTQMCAIDLRSEATNRLIYTRVAGVSCAVVSEAEELPTFRFWVDRSYADYLFGTIAGIVKEMSGTVCAAASKPPDAASHWRMPAKPFNSLWE